MYHRDYSARLLAAHRRYPDMTVFTTDYVIEMCIRDRVKAAKIEAGNAGPTVNGGL